MRYPTNDISFASVPSVEVRAALKSYGFRWDRVSQQWRAPQSVETAAVCDHLAGGGSVATLHEHVTERSMEAACDII